MSEGVRAIFAEARNERIEKNEEKPYGGVLCKSCGGLVAFDIAPYVSFGPKAASVRPGAIRCGHGHNHTYFPRDFQFCASAVPIPEAAMRENREVFRAINSLGQRSSHDVVFAMVEPVANLAADDSVRGLEIRKMSRESSGPDPRREAAQAAAKERWTNWAGLKAL